MHAWFAINILTQKVDHDDHGTNTLPNTADLPSAECDSRHWQWQT
jgi:hypothetical protein